MRLKIVAVLLLGLFTVGCAPSDGPWPKPGVKSPRVSYAQAPMYRDPKSPDVVIPTPPAPPRDGVLIPAPSVPPVIVDAPKASPITKADCEARAATMKWQTALGPFWRKGRWRWLRKCMRGEV